jgi:tetratricopeptide (TPR) repeat protein
MSRGDQSALAALDSEEARRSANPRDDVRLAGILLKSSPTAEQKEEARRLIRRAIDGFGQVAIDYPNDLMRRVDALDGYGQAIMACSNVPDFALEIDELNRRHTVEIPKFLAAFPDSTDGQWWTASLYRGWAKCLYPYGNHLPMAQRAFTNAIEIYEKLSVTESSKLPSVWLYLVDTYLYLADIQWRLSGLEAAGPAFRRAMEIFEEHTAELEAGTPDKEYQAIAIDYVCIADFLVATEREEEAAEYVRKATLAAARRVTDAAQSAEVCFYLGLMQLRVGDHDGYRATCKTLADLPFTTASDPTKGNTVLVWILASDALADMSLVVKRAEEFAASNSLGYRHTDLFHLGAAHLRAGDYNQAAQLLQQSIDVYPSDRALPPGFRTINWQRLFLAMTKWRQGQRDEARQLLAEAQAAIDEQLQPPSPRMEFRLYTDVLRREAEKLIKPKEADEAVENKTRTSNAPKQ